MGARLIIHAPRVETEDIDPDSVTGVVLRGGASPAVRVDGSAVDEHPERGSDRRMEVPLRPGKHRVEVMVKQTYETVLVDLAEDETAELRIAYKRDRLGGEDRLFVGSKPYVDRAFAVNRSAGWGAFGCGVGLWFLALAVVGALVGVFGASLGLEPGQAVAGALVAATAVAVVGGLLVWLASRRKVPDAGEVATGPVPMGGGAQVLPAAVSPPAGRSGIVLRVRPRSRTLNMIGFTKRLRDTVRATYYEFYFNELVDWVAPPRVTLDGRELGAAWGTWWIPAGAGMHRLRVEIDGIGGYEVAGVAGETDVRVGGGIARVVARFNFIAMAHRRHERHPALESRWQRVMRRADRYEDMAGQALAEPDLEFERLPEQSEGGGS
ncbi:hypothetical protein [Glycomyces salinus]|uniref:hypothetical protein n=1 Tax=Glycomyces salinus TaxID=980294 RepID=UPI0018ECC0F9|nr:hypothetical protein [Glycomyces salinus]